MKGLLVTFEGCEGSGKSTHSEKIYQTLIKKSYPVVLTHEPGGTRFSEKIRELLLSPDKEEPILPYAEWLLYLASRAQHVEKLILPALKTGKIVLCDRFTDATVAYQGYGRGLDIDMLNLMNDFITRHLMPDYTILLDIDPGIGLERSKRLKKNFALNGELDRMESQSLEFHQKVRNGYIEIAKAFPNRVSIFDTSTVPVEETLSQIQDCIMNLIQKHGLS
ncbi:MAG: dTMP kinase [Candidatus Aureabacteria bacterium]|nr:dTMP kinase [Candidatus Auribacterota bacterium]